MPELNDYSGEFRPGARLEDFSKETIAKVLIAWNRLNLVLDRWWQDLLVDRGSEADLAKVQDSVWKRWTKKRPQGIRKALSIDGKDLVSFLKCLQLDSCLCYGVYNLEWELEPARRATLTVREPVALPQLMDLTKTDTNYRAAWLEADLLQSIAHEFHPEIKVRDLPPGDAFRKFEFVLDQDGEASALPLDDKDDHELHDYNGPFRPNLRYQHLAKPRLMKLAYLYAGLGLDLDAHWQMAYRKKYGDKEGVKAEIDLWKYGSGYWQMQTIKALNIRGNDVAAAMKAMQMDPQHLLFGLQVELIDANHGTWTNRHCHAVDFAEATDDLYMLMNMCKLDWEAYRVAASHFNDKIEVFPLEYPPRWGTDVCCKWEFRLRSDAEEEGKP